MITNYEHVFMLVSFMYEHCTSPLVMWMRGRREGRIFLHNLDTIMRFTLEGGWYYQIVVILQEQIQLRECNQILRVQ